MPHIDPEIAAFKAFKALNRDEPIQMLNLIRLKPEAVYTDGRTITGLEAYKTYGQVSGPIFQRVGGQILWRGRPENTLIGPADEAWDLSFIAAYPSAKAFLEMVTDPVYQTEAVPHRQAAVADSRLVRHAVLDGGSVFG
jgi:uncharacterized protein (DUF1330 family)